MCAALSGMALGCDRAPADLREWKASDHDHTSNPGAAQVEVKQNAPSALAVYGIDEVTVVAWERNCASCHGAQGEGNGPQGPLTKARNLRDPAWQAAATDEGIAQVIRNGRGMMPASKLPEPTVQSLVRLVRLLDPRRAAAAAASAQAAGSAAPHGSLAPSATAAPTSSVSAAPPAHTATTAPPAHTATTAPPAHAPAPGARPAPL
jgi:mono/diheme cytochrome c family protein